jgi:hypothetical protein
MQQFKRKKLEIRSSKYEINLNIECQISKHHIPVLMFYVLLSAYQVTLSKYIIIETKLRKVHF